jgi:hypothetical protein
MMIVTICPTSETAEETHFTLQVLHIIGIACLLTRAVIVRHSSAANPTWLCHKKCELEKFGGKSQSRQVREPYDNNYHRPTFVLWRAWFVYYRSELKSTQRKKTKLEEELTALKREHKRCSYSTCCDLETSSMTSISIVLISPHK